MNISTNTVLFREGEVANKMFIIKRGQIICLKKINDRLIPVHVAQENDFIGEAALIPGELHSYSAICQSDAELTEVPADMFLKFFDGAPSWLSRLYKTMLGRYQTTIELLASNRILNHDIIAEDKYPPSVEVEYKKILSKTE
jgi:CRP-like cAMP-binding protein